MKKSLLALGIVAVSTSAFAQSNMQLYGLMDVGYGVTNGGQLEGASGNQGKFQQLGNGSSTSRWGIKGGEDLGNGLKVFFQLESSIDPESGEAEGFDRVALIGLSGALGEISFGRQNAIVDDVLFDFSPIQDPNLTSANINAGVSSGQRVNRYNSMLKYVSPDLAGFSLRASYVAKNDEAGVGNLGQKNLFAVAGSYKWQGLHIGAAYESKLVSTPGVSSSWGLGATYDFGSFLVGGGYFDNHYKDDGKGFYVGASLPYGAFVFAGQIAYNTDAYKQDHKIKPLAWELTATYSFSNRTSLYLMYGGINNDAKAFANAQRRYSAAFGLVHSF